MQKYEFTIDELVSGAEESISKGKAMRIRIVHSDTPFLDKLCEEITARNYEHYIAKENSERKPGDYEIDLRGIKIKKKY